MTLCSSKCSPIATWRADASAQSPSVVRSCGTFSLIPPHNPPCNTQTEYDTKTGCSIAPADAV